MKDIGGTREERGISLALLPLWRMRSGSTAGRVAPRRKCAHAAGAHSLGAPSEQNIMTGGAPARARRASPTTRAWTWTWRCSWRSSTRSPTATPRTWPPGTARGAPVRVAPLTPPLPPASARAFRVGVAAWAPRRPSHAQGPACGLGAVSTAAWAPHAHAPRCALVGPEWAPAT